MAKIEKDKDVIDLVGESIKIKTAYDVAEQAHKAQIMKLMMEWLALQTDLTGSLRKPPPITPTQCLMIAEKCLNAYLRLVYKPKIEGVDAPSTAKE